MYRVIAYDDPTEKIGKVIFDVSLNKYISSGSLNLKENDIDDFTLGINQNNELFGNVKPLNTHIEIFKNKNLMFRGRALKPKRSMKQNGQFIQEFSFESISAYLLDSTQRFLEVHNMTPADFFKKLISVHNSQVPAYKQFKVGTVDVTNSTDNVYRYVDYTNTYDAINDKLISRLGGYLRIRYENGINYIDYLREPGKSHENDTPIRIGRNLQSSSVEIDPTEVITRLVPLGATIERKNNPASNPRVDIKSVNGGKDYIDIPDLQKEFGIINGSNVWDDVKDSKNLLTKAKDWIKKQSTSSEHWSVAVLELGSNGYSDFNVSDSYMFVNQNVAEKQLLRVTAKQVDLLKPHTIALTIGDKKKTLSQYQSDNKKTKEAISQLKTSVSSQASSVGDLKTQTQALRTDVDSQKTKIESIETKVDGINLEEIKTKISSLETDIKRVDSELLNYKNTQDAINEDVENRLTKIETGGVDNG